MQNPSLGAGTGYVPPKFGSDRNIDPEQIRQRQFLEIQRQREERQRAKAAGEDGKGAAAAAEPARPTMDELLEAEEAADDAGAATEL